MITDEQLDVALGVIAGVMGDAHDELVDGLPGGSEEDWGYDRELVVDIAAAIKRWADRCKSSP